MGLFDTIFGGGAKKEDTLTHGQRAVLDKLGTTLLPEIGQGAETYPGQLIAGTNNFMRGGLSGLGSLGQFGPQVDAAYGSMLSGAGNPQDTMDFYQSQLGPARQEFDNVLQGLEHRYAPTYGNSGAIPKMAGNAAADFGTGLSGLLGQLTFDDRNLARDRQMQALMGGQQINAGRAAPYAAMYDAGATERGIEQEGINADYAQWMSGQWYNNPSLQLLGPLLGTQAFQNVQNPGALGAITGAIKGGTEAGVGLMGLFS